MATGRIYGVRSVAAASVGQAAIDAAAILGTARQIQYFVAFADLAGGALVADSFEVERQLKDVPDQINGFNGVATAQATITLSESVAARLSPYSGSGSSAKLRSRVSVAVQVTGPSGVPTSIYFRFSGVVTEIVFASTGECTITALDDSSQLGGSTKNLPTYMIDRSTGADMSMWGISPLAVIDAAFRAGGKYLTPPPPLSAALRAQYTVLAVSGCGGYIPEIGWLVAGGVFDGVPAGPADSATRITGKFTPDVIVSNGPNFLFQGVTDPLATSITADWMQMDGWFQGSALSFGFAYCGLSASITTSGTLQVWNSDTAAYVADGTWHHLVVKVVPTATTLTHTAILDGVSYGPYTATNTLQTAPVNPLHLSMAKIYPGIAWEGLEVMWAPSGSGATAPAGRYNQTPGVTSALTATPSRLFAITPEVVTDLWTTVQQVAQADGALAWFDETGVFRYEPHTTWVARKLGTPSSTYTGDRRLSGISVHQSRNGLYGSVSATFTSTTLAGGTFASPVWAATDTIIVKAGSTLTQRIQCNPLLSPIGFYPAVQAIAMVTPAGTDPTSYYGAIDARRVGDPAAPQLSNLTINIRPASDGFTLTISNPNGYAVALYNNTALGAMPVGPALVVVGKSLNTAEPTTITATANPAVATVLSVDDNPWRQDQTTTTVYVTGLAGDVYAVVPSFDSISVPGDPRLQVGDLISIQDARLMTIAQKAFVVGITDHADPNSAYLQDLQLRALGPANTWVLGVPGLSELGSTTTLASA